MLFIFSLAVAIVALLAWNRARRRASIDRNPVFQTSSAVAGIVGILFILIAASQMFTVVPAGNVGVVDFFGTVSDNTLKAGINFVNPMARVVKFSVKTQEIKEVMDVPSKEGLTVQLEISALFHLNPEKAAEVYK
ncbi:MAG: prohibitin family protein, partial [Ignavibacteriales bacterium]|nr:prohibitin family protein [Ignavibacteriales bacterium]